MQTFYARMLAMLIPNWNTPWKRPCRSGDALEELPTGLTQGSAFGEKAPGERVWYLTYQNSPENAPARHF